MLTTRNELIDFSSDPIARVRWARAFRGQAAGERPAGGCAAAAAPTVVVPSTVSRVIRLMAR